MFKWLKEPGFWWLVTAVVVGLLIMFPPAGFAVSVGVTWGTIAVAVVPAGIAGIAGSLKDQKKEQSRARQEQFMESLNKQTPEAGRNRPKQSPENDKKVENTESNSAKKGNRKSAKSPNDLVNAVKKELEAEKQKQKNNAPD